MDNDSKAIDLNFKDTIEFMGKKRKLGRTNLEMRARLKRASMILEKLESMGLPTEEEEKEFNEYLQRYGKQARDVVKKVIKPLSKEELDSVDLDDLETLNRQLTRRTLLRRGFSPREILKMEQDEREVQRLTLEKTREKIETGEIFEEPVPEPDLGFMDETVQESEDF